MIKTAAVWAYRGTYCAFLGVVLAGLLFNLPVGESLRPFEHWLYYTFIGSLASAVFCAIAFTRLPEWLIWSVSLIVSGLFIWYAWFMQGAPFMLHELHTLDPVKATRELQAFQRRSIVATAIILGLFAGLPVLRHFRTRPY